MRSIADVDWNPCKDGHTITEGKVKPVRPPLEALMAQDQDLLKALAKEAHDKAVAALADELRSDWSMPSVVVSRVAMVTPAATCWPGCTVTVATRPLVAKSRLAVFVGWIVPVAPMVCRTVPSWAATVRYWVPPELVTSHALMNPP